MASSHDRASARRGPPQLRLRLLNRLSWLAVFNILPLAMGAYLWWQWRAGRLSFVADQGIIVLILILLALAIFIGTACFIILPIFDWSCRRTRWEFHHSSRLVWAVPVLATHVATFGAWVLCLAIFLAGLWISGLVAWQSVATGQTNDAPHGDAPESLSPTAVPSRAQETP